MWGLNCVEDPLEASRESCSSIEKTSKETILNGLFRHDKTKAKHCEAVRRLDCLIFVVWIQDGLVISQLMLSHTVCFRLFTNLYLSSMPVSILPMYYCGAIGMRSKHIAEINIAFTCLMAWIWCSLEGLSKVKLMEMKLRASWWKGRAHILIGDMWKDSPNYCPSRATTDIKNEIVLLFFLDLATHLSRTQKFLRTRSTPQTTER